MRESRQQSGSNSTTTAAAERQTKLTNTLPCPLNPTPSIGADFPNYNIREYIRRRARERFREAAAAAATEGGAASSTSSSSTSPADLAFSAGLKELEAAKRQAALAVLYHRPQRSVMDVMSTEEHLRREAGRGA